jgi:hypothetical protein
VHRDCVISGFAIRRARDGMPAPKAHDAVPPIGGWQERIDRGERLAASGDFPSIGLTTLRMINVNRGPYWDAEWIESIIPILRITVC